MKDLIMTYSKISQEISDPVNENIQKLAALFPSAVKDGELDIDALKQELGQFNEVGPEKYELTWAGKQEAKQASFKPILGKTLKYIPEDSKHSDTTENLFIEGDNLDALKLLHQNYYGAVKMIYIDPPYNTGNDFVYNDTFRMSKKESDIAIGDASDLGERYTINRKDQNRYHANWLNMMCSRLKVAKDLLQDDGLIFISIDEIEVFNLKLICDEIFGNHNFVEQIAWKNKYGSGALTKGFANVHEYILVYSKGLFYSIAAPLNQEQKASYTQKDEKYEKRGGYITQPLATNSKDDRPNLKYTIHHNGVEINPEKQWIWSEDRFLKAYDNNDIVINERNGKYSVRSKQYLKDENGVERLGKPISLLNGPFNQEGTKEIKSLFNNKAVFDFPKPTSLIKYLLSFVVNDSLTRDGIILDFFSGSAPTAQAVMQLNAEDKGNRKFIMVQLPEPCDEKSISFKEGYKNICQISRERIRRAGEKIFEENKDKEGIVNLDMGFKAFQIGDTNINWLHQDLKDGDLFDHYDKNASDKDKLDFTPDFTDMDVVYEIMLRQTDIPLSSKVEQLTDIGERTYIFADSFLVCLEQSITRELVDRLASIEPLPIKFVFRDSAFDDDIALKDETFRTLSALIERNCGGEKQTYTVEFI